MLFTTNISQILKIEPMEALIADPASYSLPFSFLAARALQAEPPEHAPHAGREGPLGVGGRPHAGRRRPLPLQVLLRAVPERQVRQRYVQLMRGQHVFLADLGKVS